MGYKKYKYLFVFIATLHLWAMVQNTIIFAVLLSILCIFDEIIVLMYCISALKMHMCHRIPPEYPAQARCDETSPEHKIYLAEMEAKPDHSKWKKIVKKTVCKCWRNFTDCE